MVLSRQGSSLSAGSSLSQKQCIPYRRQSSSKLFQPGVTLVVKRAPIMSCLSLRQKPFQRPMLKRRAYGKEADLRLKTSTLGQRRRFGMNKILARSGKGLSFMLPSRTKKGDGDTDDSEDSDDEDETKEPDRPFTPLEVWTSPHQGGEARGLPPKLTQVTRPDENGIDETVTILQSPPASAYSSKSVFVPPVLAKWLREHQREGVRFMYECVMGLKSYDGNGCILADDMGLGKTLQSVSLIYTLLKTGITANGAPTAKRVIVICPCSLVKNWENEFVKWLGPGAVKTLAIAEADRKKVERDIDSFVNTKIFNVMIASYECVRMHIKRITRRPDHCDLLVCDEAHRLKNSDNQTSRALNSLNVKRRVLLTGTPMQNDLQEFYAMVDFTNPGILGTPEEFRRKMLFPILRGREPDATDAQKRKMEQLQNDLSSTVADFILRRVNTLNAQHLPPKLVQVVCCNLTEIQLNMYQHLVNSKDMQHVLDGKQVNCLGSIQMLMKLCNHPSLIAEEDKTYGPKAGNNKRSAAKKVASYADDEKETAAAPGADGVSKFLPFAPGGRGATAPVFPEWSGKMFVLYRLMKEMRKPGNGNDKIVIVSNYTQTLDLIGRMCRENSWGFCRLDGSINMKKRQKMVDDFNDPSSSVVAFLLSSKAGGCGLNLIGGNRLVLFDPDWNPAVDKQAAARCWRDGQKKRCFTYRFMATGTVEEKIFQRQLSKEGLQSVVDDKEQVNALSTKDLRNLFKLRTGTPSDTHDKLRCNRCAIIHDNHEIEEAKVLPKRLAACRELLDEVSKHEDARHFLLPLVSADHGIPKEEYEKIVKQPMDLGTIRKRLDLGDKKMAYKNASAFSKDVNRIFTNVMRVWSPGDGIADAARRLQGWWMERWTALVPHLMSMKPDEDEKKEKDELDQSGDSEMALCANVHNERGDDYQEQIGMPDEENMRHWSHHHRTDTVDDPVFRAAMRGCDAVSFVFGLEVTWSLIQERQQEEEERQAMEALNAIETGEESDDDDDDDDDDDGSTNSKVVCETIGDHENGADESSSTKNSGADHIDTESNSSDNECERSEEEISKNARKEVLDLLVDSDSEENGMDFGHMKKGESTSNSRKRTFVDDDSSSEDDEENLVHGTDAAAALSPSSDGTDSLSETDSSASCKRMKEDPSNIDATENPEDDDPTSRETIDNPAAEEFNKENQEIVPKNMWACAGCTLHNKKSARKCAVCGTTRP